MGYIINDFVALMIGSLIVYATFTFANINAPKHLLNGADLPPAEIAVLYVLVPFCVWYVYQALLWLGPKGSSKAIKI